jgi:hypothetical protein
MTNLTEYNVTLSMGDSTVNSLICCRIAIAIDVCFHYSLKFNGENVLTLIIMTAFVICICRSV